MRPPVLVSNVGKAFRRYHAHRPGTIQQAVAQGLEGMRPVEKFWGLRGVTADDPAQELAAVAVAKTFRLDATLPKTDRFDVAVAMDSQSLALRQRSGAVTNKAPEQKKLVESWRTEFGDMFDQR